MRRALCQAAKPDQFLSPAITLGTTGCGYTRLMGPILLYARKAVLVEAVFASTSGKTPCVRHRASETLLKPSRLPPGGCSFLLSPS